MDVTQSHHQSGASPGHRRFRLRLRRIRESDTIYVDDIYTRVTRTAKSLYQCYLSCTDAFPPPIAKEEWAKNVWNEACARRGTHPDLLRQNKEVGLFLPHVAQIHSDF
jgi:hypothetical protein